MNQKRKKLDFDLSDSEGECQKRVRSEFVPSLEMQQGPLERRICHTQGAKVELDEEEPTDVVKWQEEQRLNEMQRTILKHGGEQKVLKKFGNQK